MYISNRTLEFLAKINERMRRIIIYIYYGFTVNFIWQRTFYIFLINIVSLLCEE